MRYYSMLGSMLALAGASAAASSPLVEYIPVNPVTTANFSGSPRRRTGKQYPHSSDRQNARIGASAGRRSDQFHQARPRRVISEQA